MRTKHRYTSFSFPLLAALVAPIGCATDSAELPGVKSDGKGDSSALAVFLDAEWDATLVTTDSYDDQATIESQLYYTVGQLNGENSVGRIDTAKISNIRKTTRPDGRIQIDYHAKMLVAWGDRTSVPDTFDLKLPADLSYRGQEAFATKYGQTCVDWSAHDVDAGSMFYYFRPNASRCALDPADIHTVTATLTPSPIQTTGKFPEYHKIWEDNRFEVVAIFGKNEDGATSGDVGIYAYNNFIQALADELGTQVVTIPATLPAEPGVEHPDIEFNALLPDGKQVRVVALLTDNVRLGLQEPEFRARYENLSSRADYIVYNGHAGLGTNVRAMAEAGKWVPGQYVVVQLNGCDTFAYIDSALNRAHQEINSDDLTGYKYIDLVNNAMPAFFSDLSDTTMAMFRGLLAHDAPQTYEQIFREIASAQVILVSGEQDNVFTPGGGGQPVPTWAGMTETGILDFNTAMRWVTPVLEAGTYQFTMTGTYDADLYLRIGAEPNAAQFDCRPYASNSEEACEVTLAQPAAIHLMVRGASSSMSEFKLVGSQK